MYKNELQKQLIDLKNVIKETNTFLANAPEGNLRINRKNNNTEYYHITKKNDVTGRYIRAEDKEFAFDLAKKQYYIKINTIAKERYKMINTFLKRDEKLSLCECYDGLSDARKMMVEPLALSNEEYAIRWSKIPYVKKDFAITDPEYYTDKGLRVRSKSEIIIAHILDEMGLFYKYECPVNINGKEVYVDFTILNPHSREEVYYEHFGMMNNERYLKDFFWKQTNYLKSGIILGHNFFMTFESEQNPINTKDLRTQLFEIFKEYRI